MKQLRLTAMACVVGLVGACSSTRHQAPVVDRALTSPPPTEVVAVPAPAVVKPVVDAPGYHTVRRGETLMRIALDHGLSYRDIAAWNNLSDPNDIKADQVLRMTPPDAATLAAQAEARKAQAGAATPATAGAPGAPGAPAQGGIKTGPRADKKPYSEANLAEMQKADGAGAAPAAPVAAVAAAPKPAVKPAEAVADDGISWMWPAEGKVVAGFDEGKNKGIDIAGKAGQQVVAASAGKIMYAGNAIRGYGNLVIVRHNNNVSSAYAHNAVILVKEEQMVQKGQVIAEMGSTDADAVKLHFEIRQQGKPVDPSKLLPAR